MNSFDPAIEEIDAIETWQGRLLCFPSTLQHRLQPLSLLGKTKPEYRKVLAIFLCRAAPEPH